MTYNEYSQSKSHTDVANTLVAELGGHFFGEEPGFRLLYETADGESVYHPADSATPEQVLHALKRCVREKSLDAIVSSWMELEFDPELVY